MRAIICLCVSVLYHTAVAIRLARRVARHVKSPPGTIKNEFEPSLCLDEDLSNQNVYMHRCHGGSNQLWYFRDGQIHNVLHGVGWCLDRRLDSGKNLYMHRCHSGWNQKFRVVGAAILVGDECMDQRRDGSNVYVHQCQGQSNQKWKVGGAITLNGNWKPVQALQYLTEITAVHGTQKSETTTKSSDWSAAVSATVSGGSLGLGLDVSASVGLSLTRTHSSEWSVSETSAIKLGFEYISNTQVYLWQWQYKIETSNSETVITKTLDYAITAGAWEKPKCVPGYCTDHPRCQTCRPEGVLR